MAHSITLTRVFVSLVYLDIGIQGMCADMPYLTEVEIPIGCFQPYIVSRARRKQGSTCDPTRKKYSAARMTVQNILQLSCTTREAKRIAHASNTLAV